MLFNWVSFSFVCTSTGNGLEGTALAYFRVNQSPVLGHCTIRPNPELGPGIEMETTYSVFCQEWKDEVCMQLKPCHSTEA